MKVETLSDLAKLERSLPPLWDDGFHPERVEFYTEVVVGHPLPWGGREDVAELIAAMMLESGLDNLTLGNNAKHGRDNPFIGVGWCQCDSGYSAPSVELIHRIRANPVESLDIIAANDELVLHRGAQKIWLRKERWNAWDPKKIDPAPYTDEDGNLVTPWSPYAACLVAYDRVTA